MSESGAMTLTEFLLARIAEDEAVAQRPSVEEDGNAGGYGTQGCFPTGEFQVLTVDPSRVLAECEAKRRIVEDLTMAEWRLGMPPATVEFLLRALAAAHADHPDYDESWRP